MAVLKSTAYGQVRKSVGANNYYRRSGVQIVRSKPTFAPGRTFTPAQLSQQEIMKIAQYMMLEKNAKVLADFCNITNNRKYNASSKYNRLVSHLMTEIKSVSHPVGTDLEDFWNMEGVYIFKTFTIGNIQPFWYKEDITSTDNLLEIALYYNEQDLFSFLQKVNKRRAASGQLTVANIGICGVFNEDSASGETVVLAPVMADQYDYEGEHYLEAVYEQQFPPSLSTQSRAVISVFVADVIDINASKVISTPQFCTASKPIRKTIEEERPGEL